MVAPGWAISAARLMVRNGRSSEPSARSDPVVATWEAPIGLRLTLSSVGEFGVPVSSQDGPDLGRIPPFSTTVEVRTTEVRMHRTDNFRLNDSLADTWRSAGHVFGHFRSVLETYREDVG